MVRAVAPKPVNVLSSGTVSERRRIRRTRRAAHQRWRCIGACRMGAVLAAAEQIKAGSFDGLRSGAPSAKLNELFGNFSHEPSKS